MMALLAGTDGSPVCDHVCLHLALLRLREI